MLLPVERIERGHTSLGLVMCSGSECFPFALAIVSCHSFFLHQPIVSQTIKFSPPILSLFILLVSANTTLAEVARGEYRNCLPGFTHTHINPFDIEKGRKTSSNSEIKPTTSKHLLHSPLTQQHVPTARCKISPPKYTTP